MSELAKAACVLSRREPVALVAALGLCFEKLRELYPSDSVAATLVSQRGGVWGDEGAPGVGNPVLRSTNMRGHEVSFDEVAWRVLPPVVVERNALEDGDILVTKSSGSEDLVGKAVLFRQPPNGKTYLASNFTLCLRPNKRRVNPAFMAFFLRSPQALSWRTEQQQNAVGLRNLQTGPFLVQPMPLPSLGDQAELVRYFEAVGQGDTSCPLPLPPLAEQRRLVERISRATAAIGSLEAERESITPEVAAFHARAASDLLDTRRWQCHVLGSLLIEAPRNGLSPKPELEYGGRPMLRINAVSSAPDRYVDTKACKMVAVTDTEASSYEIKHDDVFIVRYNGDINRVAKAAIHKRGETMSEEQAWIFPDKLMRLRPHTDRMTPDFLVYALGSRSVRKQIEELGKSTAGNIGISGADAKGFVLPVPPLEDQRRIVVELDALQTKVDEVKRLQAESAKELAALMPSILSRAFRGEL